VTKIRTLQSHNKQVEASVAGTRTALNLPDLQAGTDVLRGDVVTVAGLGNATDTWDVLLEKSGRAQSQSGGKSTPARPLKTGSLARLHIGSANIPVHVQLLESKTLAPGERALAQMRFDAPLFAFVGDHFILRDWSEQATLAGGTILSVNAQRRHARTDQYRELLQSRADALHDPTVFVASQLKRDHVVKSEALLFSPALAKRLSMPPCASSLRKRRPCLSMTSLPMRTSGPPFGVPRSKPSTPHTAYIRSIRACP
jgi:selenocysteine-specific translation elongation factor